MTQQEWDSLTRHQQVDLLMADKHYHQVLFSEVQEWYARHIDEKGFRNPLTDKLVGSQPKSLDGGELHHACAMLRMLKKDLHRLGLTMSDYLNSEVKISYHYKDVWKAITILLGEEDLPESDKTCPTSFNRLKLWEIIDNDKTKVNPLIKGKGKHEGYWYLTNTGIKFLYNKIALQKTVISKGGKHKFEGDKIYFSDCAIITYEERQKYRTTNF